MARNKTPIAEKYNAPFPTALRKLMEERGETQENIAKAIEKTRQTVSQYVNGISEPGYDTLVKIADYFDVSSDYLLGRTNDPNRKPCAADELRLSDTAVRKMSNFLQLTSMGQDGIAGLNLLIEKGSLLELAYNIKLFCDHIAEDMAMSQHYTDDTSDNFSDPKLKRIQDDFILIDQITDSINKAFPDSNGRFRILSGYRFIAAEKREIVDEFEKMICKVSNYDQFLSTLPGQGMWL